MNQDYIKYTGKEIPFAARHDGMLRLTTGTRHVQVLRANRKHPHFAEGYGHTYNHAPNLVYWNDRFYCHWLSNPVSEHIGVSQTYLSTSANGINWDQPQVLFPPYPLDLTVENGHGKDLYTTETAYACMHQRMGFYIAPNKRLLTLGYYGISAEVAALPCVGRGIGRVVREIYADGSFGPIFFLIMNHNGGYGEHNAVYPLYTKAENQGFVEACKALLADKLVMLQMWEENRDCEEDYFAIRGAGEAFNHYTLKNGTVIGLWKHSMVSKSIDHGNTWQPIQKCCSLVMSGGKIWGQHTSDNQYALFYNPVTDSCHRWPLAVVTSQDGIEFTEMLCAMGEVPPQRYWGFWRDYGPQYVRGLESDADSPDGNVWLTYSMNKEDIWVSCIAAPISSRVERHVEDDFSSYSLDSILPYWHLYSPQWAQVSLVDHPTPDHPEQKALRLRHKDPCDCAKAIRIFPESTSVQISFALEARQNYFGRMDIDIMDGRGLAVFRIIFDKDRTIKLKYGNGFMPVCLYSGGIVTIELSVDCYTKLVDVKLQLSDGTTIQHKSLRFFGNTNTLERIEFRAGQRKCIPAYDHDIEFAEPIDLEGTDEPLVQESIYYIYQFKTSPGAEKDLK